ncbi:hypothetical protein FACS1894159_01660 [Bacteroidia bacterium]|nr:hypothetical protein FACS1894159_01660 [Bacteroidia bacterium]
MKKIILAVALLLVSPWIWGRSMQCLPLKEIQAGGWIKKQMERDITSGYISAYDQIQVSMQGDVFGPQKAKNYSIDRFGNWETRRETWWPGEHEGYFADIVVRNAFLTGHKPWIDKARGILDKVLAAQALDRDGYIGIYDRECRLDNLLNENGELWTQSRMLNALLAFYEYTGERKYFDAAKKAADHTLDRYVKSGKTYFQQPKPNGGGLTHGLMFCETMEWLSRLAGERKYLDFGRWLYRDYSAAKPELRNVDCQLGNLLDRERLFQEHSVHVCEHMRVVFWLSNATGEKALSEAVDNIFYKYKASQGPSGCIVMDPVIHESVAGNYGSGYLPYEYCSITESVISFASAMQKFGSAWLGDQIEKLTFNAGQGARLPDGKAISYATADNRRDALEKDGFRNQVAACHKVACCNLNAAKLMPYYVANMWMKGHNGRSLYATLLGASTLNTKIGAANVKIEEQTGYPFDNRVVFVVEPSVETTFSLAVRNPAWSKNTVVEASGATQTIRDGFIVLSKKWRKGDRVEIVFDEPVEIRRFMDNESYMTKGALIYAARIDEAATPTAQFIAALANYDLAPKNMGQAATLFEKMMMPANPATLLARKPDLYTFEHNPDFDADYPFDAPYGRIKARLVDEGHNNTGAVFVPMGSAALRKITFREDK